MKAIFVLMAMSVSVPAFATVDALDRAYIVVQNIQEEEEFAVERAPFVGCYGLPQGARLVQWTSPVEVLSNIGCGGTPVKENINALSCAKVINAEESADFGSFAKIELDISACPYKDNKQFITMVRTSAAKNFPQSNKSKEVVLKLIR